MWVIWGGQYCICKGKKKSKTHLNQTPPLVPEASYGNISKMDPMHDRVLHPRKGEVESYQDPQNLSSKAQVFF